MSDTIAQSVTPSTSATEILIKDLAADVALVKQAIATGKAGGVAALAPLLPQVVSAVETGIKDVESALPEIKAGYKTTEFWAVIGVCVGGTAYVLVIGKDIPVNLSVCAAAIVSIYTVARTLFKAKATPAS